MKSNDVIAIKEGVISDIGNKMFGGGKKADKKGNSNRQAAPQIGDGGTTSTKRLAKKLFVQDETTYYKAPLPQGKIKLSSEHDKYKFIMLSEIDDYEISQKFKEAIRRAHE